MSASGSVLRYLDIFDKFNDDELRVRTRCGTILSIFLAILSGLYLAIQTVRLFTPKIHRDLALAPSVTNQRDFVNISLSIFVDLPCYLLHLDAIDSLGFSQLNINGTARLRRVNASGRIIGVANQPPAGACHPCYGALPAGACCNSCEQLLLMFALKNLTAEPQRWPQCAAGAPPRVSLDEKCLVKGKISVNKVPGLFHIAPGRNDDESPEGEHAHDLSGVFPSLALSHRINGIRFGASVPTANAPLAGLAIAANVLEPMRYRYIMMATPLVYIKNGCEKARGYEYTTMITIRKVRPGMAPGIFFDYSFTPYGVVVNAVSRSFLQYLTSTLGFLSGAFALVMLLDTFLHETGLLKKITKGK
jgi:hypothetical protein